jgi:hypothetical protein
VKPYILFAHVINLTAIVALKGDVPENVWSSKNSSYDHQRVFGCKTFVHIPKYGRLNHDNVYSSVMVRPSLAIGYMDINKK